MAQSIFDLWAKAKPHIERAVAELHGTHTIDDIALMVGSGHLRVWVGEKSAVLTEITYTPRIKALNCFIGAGDLDELVKIRDEILTPFAKENGCVRITGAGRKGWTRALPGFEYGGIYMHKDI